MSATGTSVGSLSVLLPGAGSAVGLAAVAVFTTPGAAATPTETVSVMVVVVFGAMVDRSQRTVCPVAPQAPPVVVAEM